MCTEIMKSIVAPQRNERLFVLLQVWSVLGSVRDGTLPAGAREWLMEEILKCVGWEKSENKA